jgi:hypothetical protein
MHPINTDSKTKEITSVVLKPYIIIPLLTLFVFFLTRFSPLSFLKLHFTLLSFIALILYGYFLKKKGVDMTSDKQFIYLLTASVLFLVASTGWFFSPFFFVLYLLSVFLAFIFSPSASIVFVVLLVILFSFNIGEVDLAYDFLIVLSLLTTIPLSLYLRKEYLRLKQTEKKILVLEKEKGETYEDIIQEVLANKVNNFSADMRQPINDTKQLAFYIQKHHKNQEINESLNKIIFSSEEALKILSDFEAGTTGKKILSTPKKES